MFVVERHLEVTDVKLTEHSMQENRKMGWFIVYGAVGAFHWQLHYIFSCTQ